MMKIISPSHHHCHLHTFPVSLRRFSHSSNPIKTTPSTFQFPINKQLSVFNTTTSSAAPVFAAIDFASTSVAGGWAEFCEKISGEWDGFGADFTVDGKPIELPESVVPEAYREWEVKVFDWQTQCPTLAQFHNNSPSLMYKTIKLLPTVGCEADAATMYTIDEMNITAPHTCAFAYQPTGCYVALWPNKSSIELEHCLIHPGDKESRVRMIQVLELRECELKLKSIRVFVEQWYGPFRNGDQLGGCAIRDSAFAATQTLNASKVSGVWQGRTDVATFHTCNNMIQELGNERVVESIRDESDSDLILLPKQLWCAVRRGGENEVTCCEVGWLFDEGRAITSKCRFSSTAEVKEIAIASETAA